MGQLWSRGIDAESLEGPAGNVRMGIVSSLGSALNVTMPLKEEDDSQMVILCAVLQCLGTVGSFSFVLVFRDVGCMGSGC